MIFALVPCMIALASADLAVDASPLMDKLNQALSSKLGDINAKLAAGMKTKDPMMVNVEKGPLHVDKISDLSSLRVESFKVTGFHMPNLAMALSGAWSGDLNVNGFVDALGKKVPVDAALHGVSFKSDEIDMNLKRNPLEIQGFNVKSLEVSIQSITCQVHFAMPALANIVSKLADKKINESKGKIAEKLSEKMKEVLGNTLNEKIKGALNGKLHEMMR
ncbi:unnamed protein product [Symbiodinium natans]|uniref:Lipid-binding serum glycoprotein N-terminal domain-containing protein n=1 Tax=Symbiodinium natans TaxID=878477 RepID=A0A812L7U8_9DINO|nr:unnamed protein product [Symbiodinium natans]